MVNLHQIIQKTLDNLIQADRQIPRIFKIPSRDFMQIIISKKKQKKSEYPV